MSYITDPRRHSDHQAGADTPGRYLRQSHRFPDSGAVLAHGTLLDLLPDKEFIDFVDERTGRKLP